MTDPTAAAPSERHREEARGIAKKMIAEFAPMWAPGDREVDRTAAPVALALARVEDPNAFLHKSLIPLRAVVLNVTDDNGGLFGGCAAGTCY